MRICTEMYGVRVLLVPLGNKRACLGSLRVTGSDQVTIVSREAKKKQAVCDERVCYLQVAAL